jgi:hypothetical protein
MKSLMKLDVVLGNVLVGKGLLLVQQMLKRLYLEITSLQRLIFEL